MYKENIRPILDHLDSEDMHNLAREAIHIAESNPLTLKLLERFAYHGERFEDERLNVVLGGVELENPLMVGAGWDKKGRAVRGLHKLGFGGVEVGSVLAYPQFGNHRPRQWVIAPGVALNRMGFNSPGAVVVADNLERYKDDGIPIGINIGMNKDIPHFNAPYVYAEVVSQLYDYASYFVVNVSSPNTPGLRDLQKQKPLNEIVQHIITAMDYYGGRKDLFIKISPDLSNYAIDDVIKVAFDNNVTGIIAANTSNNPYLRAKHGIKWFDVEGGLSGDDDDYRTLTLDKIDHIYRQTKGNMEIIGVGGVNSMQTALEKMQSGAKAVQIVTGIRSEGTGLPGKINRELVEWMDREGVNEIEDIVGINHQNLTEV